MNEIEAIEIIGKVPVSLNYEGSLVEIKKAYDVVKKALEEIQQYREYKEIFKSHFTKEALELLRDKEEFGKWIERGKWIAKRCDEINRELEAYRAIGTVEDLKTMKENGAFSGVELAQILAMQMELKKYQYIGTIDEFKALKEKNVAKKADYKKMVYPRHKWKMEDGKIDVWAYEVGYCNGPVCERCYYAFCEHCNPNGYEGECVVEDYICPSCRENVGYKQTHCKCGQKLDWSE